MLNCTVCVLGSLQATRALMIVGIIVSIAGLGVACVGMKCTTCGEDNKERKARTAVAGGIILLIGGEYVYALRNKKKKTRFMLPQSAKTATGCITEQNLEHMPRTEFDLCASMKL